MARWNLVLAVMLGALSLVAGCGKWVKSSPASPIGNNAFKPAYGDYPNLYEVHYTSNLLLSNLRPQSSSPHASPAPRDYARGVGPVHAENLVEMILRC